MAEPARLPLGLYDQIVTGEVVERLRTAARADVEDYRGDDDVDVLVAHLIKALRRALTSLGKDHAGEQIALCNAVLQTVLDAGPKSAVVIGDLVGLPAQVLKEIAAPPDRLVRAAPLVRPETPLGENALLMNARHEPRLASELAKEIESADRIDLLCAFVRWSGVRIFIDELRRAAQRGVPIRVVTTTYTGSTEPKALDQLIALGADVRVSYDTRQTRLHAKAWLFGRDSGFSTAYVGSSNVTHSALHEGLEWNVRLSQVKSGDLIARFGAAFESYWDDDQVQPYDATRFRDEIQRHWASSDVTESTPFTITPFGYQRSMLDALEVERERHGSWRNLVVAATGTGKTVVAALDYKRVAESAGGASLLFVAHRDHILSQSRSQFRHVLRDGSFGEMLVGGQRPERGRHVFASVQSLARIDMSELAPDAYDVLIIDEFHHAQAPTYRRLLEHFKPRLLLGLTATPERTDGGDVLEWFNGHIAVELRLWDALAEGLLAPLQYFGVADNVDLSDLEWKRGGYSTSSLDDLYTGNDARLGKITGAIERIISDPVRMKALGFCVSVRHAQYMAQKFTASGLEAVAITGDTPAPERDRAVRALRNGDITAIFTVDVFNEGIDIPEVDTVLLLRPTESATVFLQQIGRGLRLAPPNKSGLTVLDFIGQQRREFRYSDRLSRLTGIPARRLERALEDQFPYLPAGCSIELDQVATKLVLENLRANVRVRRTELVAELRQCGDVSLWEYLEASGRDLDDIYRGNTIGWMDLRRSAGLRAPGAGPLDEDMTRGVSRMLHISDPERVEFYVGELAADAPPVVAAMTERQKRLWAMLHFGLRGRSAKAVSLEQTLEQLWSTPGVRRELIDVLHVLDRSASEIVTPGDRPDEPLAIRGRYTGEEVLAALGISTTAKPRPRREGVVWDPESLTDVFFVTVTKSERRFSPSTMYRDYALSPLEFHWESQSTTSVASPTGQRYISHDQMGSRVLLFVRESDSDRAFTNLGPVHYRSHSGDRPIAFTWHLDHEMSAETFLASRSIG